MTVITVFKVQNDLGQNLLDQYILPVCRRMGVILKEAPPNANRGHAMAIQAASDLVLWDCSVEKGHVYNAFNMWVKTTQKHAIVSRTPLPRNVLTRFQCAPIHGGQFSNEVIGEWLEKQLHAILQGRYADETYRNKILAKHYWMFEKPAAYFLSFRGTHQKKAEAWRQRFETSHQTTVRMVPANEYSYPTECVTLQQMWEGAARLMHEIRSIGRVLIFMTEDYFDSFWTATEFLTALWMLGRDPITGKTMLDEAFFVRDPDRGDLQSFRDGFLELGIPTLDQYAMDRFAKLINNGDPITSAPETQAPPSGFAKWIAALVRGPYGYYEPEFTTPDYWNVVRVPCPVCKPKNRPPEKIDWHQHMRLADASPASDYFGYFPVDPRQLETGKVTCPNCRTTMTLENKRGVRTLWAPIMTTEKDRNRPVIQEHKIWEVVV
ncbi:MAG: hypothetical protein DPW18_16200 [Chloroflexi bacterium]|nr:hypothetical protein [Chloroflexota bacterium]MDL1943685.1 hypothetical protein [Chloroflexi bacterium CFX2]